MKKLLFVPFFFLFLFSCGEVKDDKKDEVLSDNLKEIEIQKEIKSVDSVIVVIENTMKDIQASHEALEKALKEIQ